ncbi:hypothetical protein GIB67_032517 [Kingdonia uniflora]|uniref:No apical meristem-associated C-terminal domain-containing protein n=1 Tax=Kingdonia uniflora TaxID=39325 RepID=A0A7J7L7R6_9MAGN|nr:hypothetical protein GIB67_032517 [Kingdonia uniflora]
MLMAAQRDLLSIKRSILPLTETPSAPHDDHAGRPNLSGMPLMQGDSCSRTFKNSREKAKEDRENDAHKIYKGLNGGNDFKHREAYKILEREPRRANLRDDGLNHAVNILRNVARRTSDNSFPGNSDGSINLSEDPDGPPTPQSAGLNFNLYGSLYVGRSGPIGQKLHRKNILSQKVLEDVTASGSGVHALLDELRLEKIQANQEKERRRAKEIQHWQAKMDLEQAKEDHKIIEKNLSTLSGHQLQYYLQRQAEKMERLANRGGPGNQIIRGREISKQDGVVGRLEPQMSHHEEDKSTSDSNIILPMDFDGQVRLQMCNANVPTLYMAGINVGEQLPRIG